MTFRLLFAVLLLTFASIPAQKDFDQSKIENYIKQSETEWAEAGIKGNTSALERILADDFLGIDPDGTRYDKAKELADTKNQAGNMISNHVNEMKIRFFGDTAVAQGSETWKLQKGPVKEGTYVWTDTWVKRKDVWQIVAAEDLVLPEPSRK
jgi:ketosteroid isomerase-like protein